MLASGAPSIFPISAWTPSSFFTVRPSRITSAPARASASDTARPMPEPAPVTRITRPRNSSAVGVCERGSKSSRAVSFPSVVGAVFIGEFSGRAWRLGGLAGFDGLERGSGGRRAHQRLHGIERSERLARDAELGELARLRQYVALDRADGGVEGVDGVAERARHLLEMVHERRETL